MAKGFASAGDTAEEEISVTGISRGLSAVTAGGIPNSGVLIDGASVMAVARGQGDRDSEFARHPRLIEGAEATCGLIRPTGRFRDRMRACPGHRRVGPGLPARGHGAGDVVMPVRHANALFPGDPVEHRSACQCGDAPLCDWTRTRAAIRGWQRDVIAPGRRGALQGRAAEDGARDGTNVLLLATDRSMARVATGGRRPREATAGCRAACDARFSNDAIDAHGRPFDVARARDAAPGLPWPRIRTDARARRTWKALQS